VIERKFASMPDKSLKDAFAKCFWGTRLLGFPGNPYPLIARSSLAWLIAFGSPDDRALVSISDAFRRAPKDVESHHVRNVQQQVSVAVLLT